jgi:hypothetical protein
MVLLEIESWEKQSKAIVNQSNEIIRYFCKKLADYEYRNQEDKSN